jgi:outer membrane protein assembly factor BamA
MGQASNLGLRIRLDTDLKEGRIYFHQPYISKIHIKTDATAFALREVREAFSARRIGFSLTREEKFPKEYLFTYGYRYDHVRWNGLPPDPQYYQASDPVARVLATLTRDTRDSILDASRGEFSSHSLEYGPEWMGSETGFIRYYGQYFRYVPLDKLLNIPLRDKRGQPVPPKLVYAGGLRLGLTSAFNHKTLISPERFFAGGGTTMRGFEQDTLGPQENVGTPEAPIWRPTGGEAMFLFNNELRFPIFGILHGVGFLDIGNVYPRVADFDFSMRKSAGIGLRLKIKFIPLRFDYGWKLDRRTGQEPIESRGAFFFSIGQAF